MRFARPLRAAATASFLLLFARPLSAQQPDQAETSFDKGVAYLSAGRFEQACPLIERSYALDPRPGTLFTLAECEAKRGRVATAVARYEEYLALYPTLSPEKKALQGTREREAQAQVAALKPQVPRLTLTLPAGAPKGTIVTRDGAELPLSALGTPMPLDPGDHVITTQPPGGLLKATRVALARGETKQVMVPVTGVAAPALEAQPPPAAQPSPPPTTQPSPTPPRPIQPGPASSGPSARRVAVYVTGGVGLAGVIAGGVTGGLAIAEKSALNENCVDTFCNSKGKEAADHLQSLGLASTVCFGVGIAGLGAAAVLFFTEPSARPTAKTRRAVDVDAAFVPEPGGGTVTLKAKW